jgi:glycosyltransferase involved in cell wall biosynthesis
MINKKPISVIIPTYNDFSAFVCTYQSICNQLMVDDELIIIDSSDDLSKVKNYINTDKPKFKISNFWISPCGIYPAMNYGINKCNNLFIQILNSGDLYLPSTREKISRAFHEFPVAKIYVFEQLAGYEGIQNMRFSPTENSLWPHQSVLVHFDIYKMLGGYNEKFKLISDQVFFANARKLKKHVIISQPITSYDLDGVSSKLSFVNIKETYILWRVMGSSRSYSIVKSIFLIMKVFAKNIIGNQNLTKLRIMLFKYYSEG